MKPSQLGSLCLLAIPLTGCISPSQILMDHRLAELCAKDGGVTLYETIKLPRPLFDRYGFINFYVPTEERNSLGPLYVYDKKRTILVKGTPDGPPTLTRVEINITRKSDNRLLAHGVSYTRLGGDLFTAGVGTSKKCPIDAIDRVLLKKLFIIE